MTDETTEDRVIGSYSVKIGPNGTEVTFSDGTTVLLGSHGETSETAEATEAAQ